MVIRKRTLYFYLVVSILTTTAFVLPTLWAIPTALTLGIAALVPSVWLYTTLLLPVLLVRAGGPWILLLKGLSIACTLYVGFVIPNQMNQRLSRLAAEDQSDSDLRSSTSKPEHIAFVNRRSFPRDTDAEFQLTECDILCQRLLLNKAVKSVTIESHSVANSNKIASTTYTLEVANRCPEIFKRSSMGPLLDTVLHVVEGQCIVPHVAEPFSNGLKFDFESKFVGEDPTAYYNEESASSNVSRLETTEFSNGVAVKTTVQSSTITNRYAVPLLAYISGNYFSSNARLKLLTVSSSTFIPSLPTILKIKYGIDSTPNEKTSKHGQDLFAGSLVRVSEDTVKRLLDDNDPRQFDSMRRLAIVRWVAYANGKVPMFKFYPQNRSTVSRIITDPRVTDLTALAWMLNLSASGSESFAPAVRTRVCAKFDTETVASKKDMLGAYLKISGRSSEILPFPKRQSLAELTIRVCSTGK